LFYEQAGTGLPIVFISGGSMLDRRGWDDQFAEVARFYRAIRYDFRGMGRSSRPTGPFSPFDDLESLLDRVGAERSVLVGHSRAGGLAIDFCLDRPERVLAVVAVTPSLGGFAYSDAFEERNAAIVRAFETGGGEAVVDAFLGDRSLGPRKEAVRRRVRAIALENLGLLDIQSGWVREIEPPAIDRLEQIAQPVLVVSAEHDGPDNRAVADVLEARLPNVRRVDLPDAGHPAHLDQPELFNEQLLEFVRGLSSP
jgi:pimeloyl-ACP methyl ester carboxylesterase